MEKVDAKKSTLKIVVTGPESTGKSTLSDWLSTYFKVRLVDEFARTYLEALPGTYTQQDLSIIAKQQIINEDEALQHESVVICDTSLEVIKIWSEYKYASCSPFIIDQAKTRIPDMFLLMKPDIEWEHDTLREHPEQRDELFAIYQDELKSYGSRVVEVSGHKEDRQQKAKTAIQELLQQG